jgi:hypothetical protein
VRRLRRCGDLEKCPFSFPFNFDIPGKKKKEKEKERREGGKRYGINEQSDMFPFSLL